MNETRNLSYYRIFFWGCRIQRRPKSRITVGWHGKVPRHRVPRNRYAGIAFQVIFCFCPYGTANNADFLL